MARADEAFLLRVEDVDVTKRAADAIRGVVRAALSQRNIKGAIRRRAERVLSDAFAEVAHLGVFASAGDGGHRSRGAHFGDGRAPARVATGAALWRTGQRQTQRYGRVHLAR